MGFNQKLTRVLALPTPGLRSVERKLALPQRGNLVNF
jgi:hypothetical protein